jgi:hypothetical protein
MTNVCQHQAFCSFFPTPGRVENNLHSEYEKKNLKKEYKKIVSQQNQLEVAKY